MKEKAITAQKLKDEFLQSVDLDTDVFNRFIEALRSPKNSDEQKKARDLAIEEASKEATQVPFDVLKKTIGLLQLAKEVALKGNKNSLSDAGVAGLLAQAAAEGAYYNIQINLPNIQDSKFKTKIRRQAISLKKKSIKIGNDLREILEKELSKV